jgi:hypothetical protein
MKTFNTNTTQQLDVQQIARLGFRAMNEPTTYCCVRNGETLVLKVYLFENRDLNQVIYYTDAISISSGKCRHTTIFKFHKSDAHQTIHNYYLHQLFFDEQIEQQFEQENTFAPAAHLNPEKAAAFLNAVRFYWNSRHFEYNYQKLHGIQSAKEIIKLD